jgi:hypothetical protein
MRSTIGYGRVLRQREIPDLVEQLLACEEGVFVWIDRMRLDLNYVAMSKRKDSTQAVWRF